MAEEIFTHGGGDILSDVFNGIAAMSNTGGIVESMALFVAMIGIGYIVIKATFSGDYNAIFKWFFSIFLIWGIMFVPKKDVIIRDKLTNQSYTVANVPLGIAWFASVSSVSGYHIAEQFELILQLPNDLKYQKNGMLFGSALLTKTSQLRVQNPEFSENLKRFTQSCIFYDLLLKRYTLQELSKTDDIWQFVNQSPAVNRAIMYLNAGSESYKTCAEAVPLLSAKWNGETDTAMQRLGLKLFPTKNPAAAKAEIASSLPVAHQYLFKASRNATSTLRQAMMINALKDGSESWSNMTGAGATSAYGRARMDKQIRTGYGLLGMQAQHWLVILKIIFETIFYGIFPLLIPAFLLPDKGISLLKTYVFSFFWLQSWPIFYVIINRLSAGISADRTYVATLDVNAPHTFTLGNILEVTTGNQEVAVLAGSMVIFVPIIAFAITKGAGGFAGMVAPMLRPVQDTSSRLAEELTTGNLSQGNVSLDNLSHSNTSANKHDSNWTSKEGMMSHQTNSGAMINQAPDGTTSSDGSSVMSRFPISASLGQNLSSTLRSGLSSNQEDATRYSAERSNSLASAYGSTVQAGNSVSKSDGTHVTEGSADDQEFRKNYGEIQSQSKKFGESHGLDQSTSAAVLASASAGVGFGGFKASVGTEGKYANVSRDTYTAAQDFSKQNNLSESFGLASKSFGNSNYAKNTIAGQDYAEKISADLNQSQRASEQLTETQGYIENISKALDYSNSNSGTISQDLSNDLLDYTANQTNPDGSNFGYEKASEILLGRGENRQIRDGIVTDFMDNELQDIKESGYNITSPSPDNIPNLNGENYSQNSQDIKKNHNNLSLNFPKNELVEGHETQVEQITTSSENRKNQIEGEIATKENNFTETNDTDKIKEKVDTGAALATAKGLLGGGDGEKQSPDEILENVSKYRL